ncbi:glycosyltransferase [Psychrobacter immobilis]|uniref:glycosyltransferase n=1 Tax=Psychrobacter immobilis TaxID=498 RepID=UPI003FCFB765
MKDEIDDMITKRLYYLRQKDKEILSSDILKMMNDYSIEIEKIQREKYSLENEIKSLKLQLERYSKDVELKFLKRENRELKDKVNFLNDELSAKFKSRESQTIAFQLGEGIIEVFKSPRVGIKEIPKRTNYLVKESIKRRARKKTATKIDKILGIIVETDKQSQSAVSTGSVKGHNSTYSKIPNKAIITQSKDSKVETKTIQDDFIIPKSIDRVQFICASTQKLNKLLAKRTSSSLLLENHSFQVKSTKATTMILESSYNFEQNLWSYGLISNNPQYPSTKELISVVDTLKNKGLQVVLLDKSNIKNKKDLELFRNISDKVLYFSPNAMSDASESSEKILIKNYFDEKYFYPDESISKNNSLALIATYENIHFSEPGIINDYLKELEDLSCIIIKQNQLRSKFFNIFKGDNIVNYLDVEDLSRALKSYKVVISIVHRQQDFIPDEILFSIACGVPVVTNNANYLTEDLRRFITIIEKPSDLKSVVNDLNIDRWGTRIKKHLGYRYVMNNHTSKQFAENIYNISKKSSKSNNERPLVTVIMATKREHFSQRIIDSLACQSYENIEVVIMTQEWGDIKVKELLDKLVSLRKFKSVKVLSDDTDKTLGERLNICARHASTQSKVITKMDDDDFYFNHYIEDMLLPFSFGSYDMVGKSENFIYLEASNKLMLTREYRGAYRSSKFVAGPTLFIRKEVFEKLNGFKHINNGEDSDLIKRVLELGCHVYSADPFNFIQFRSKEVKSHTWKVDHEVFEKSCTLISNGLDTSLVNI